MPVILNLLLAVLVLATPAVSASTSAASLETSSSADDGKGLRRGARFFQPEPGFVRAKDLPEDFAARIDTVRFAIQDAFDGAATYTKYERWAYGIGNKLHIESREGTIRRRLTFAGGDAVTKGTLLESEKALRDEQFLADAILEVGPEREGGRTVKVTTYDQWTTAVIIGFQLVKGELFSNLAPWRWDELFDQEWTYALGLMESNVLGTGTRFGTFYKQELERTILEAQLSNQSFSAYNLQGSLYAASLSDGHSYHARLARPLRARDDRWGFTASLSFLELTEYVYYDANQLESVPSDLRNSRVKHSHIAAAYEGMAHDSLLLSVTRSFGRDLKVNVGPTFFRQERYQRGGFGDYDTALVEATSGREYAAAPWLRDDALLGVHASLYRYAYQTARNFRNLKWNENVETGWRLTARAALNQEWLGASNSDLWLAQEAAFGDAWRDTWFASCSLSTAWFVSSDSGRPVDGEVDASFETQWKPIPLTSTVLSGSWSSLFAASPARQLVLGAREGLSGYPSFYYSGQARALLVVEQRLFPEFEVLTIVPALTTFLAAGNTWPTYRDFDPADLHYSLGFGIRAGRSKSPSKSVQHINVSWPLGDEGLPGFSVSVLAKLSL